MQLLQTAYAKTIFVLSLYKSRFLNCQLNSTALTLHNSTGLAFKCNAAAWTKFFFVFTHKKVCLPVKGNSPGYHKRNGIITSQVKEFFIGDILCIGKKFQMLFQFIFRISTYKEIFIKQHIVFLITAYIKPAAYRFDTDAC